MLLSLSGEKKTKHSRKGLESSSPMNHEARCGTTGLWQPSLLRMGRVGGMPQLKPLHPSQTFMLQRKCACDETAKDRFEGRMQSKLAMGSSSDALEQEADQVADQVLRMPDRPSASQPLSLSSVGDSKPQRKCAACEDEEKSLQAKSLHSGLQTKR